MPQVESVRFIWNDFALRSYLLGPFGPVARDLSQRAIRVQNQAKRNASGRPGPNVQTGRLRASIFWRLQRDGNILWAEVGTNVFYAWYLEVTGVGNSGKRYPFLVPALSAARHGGLHH